MKAIGVTVALALFLLAITWALVRADVLGAEVLRFMPAALALIVAAGVAYALARPNKPTRFSKKSEVKKR
jgi:hypothetical protein